MNKKTQLDKFKQAARDLETDDDEKRFDKTLGKIAKSNDKENLTTPTNSESMSEGDE